MSTENLLFSICIPVKDDPENLRLCLTALARQNLNDCEVLVCDDGSSTPLREEDLRQTCAGVTLVRQKNAGPSVARNHLARIARGKYLFFVDADTVAAKDMLDCARQILAENPAITAFFGSYDDAPAHKSLVSTYRNLLHHYTHHKSDGKVVGTFWCGCGVMLREIYLESGGLSAFYDRPSIEDIELGARISSNGVEIRIFPQLQVKHRKLWTVRSWLHTDLFCRGIPWVRLMRATNNWTGQLNFSWTQRLATLGAMAFLASLPLAVIQPAVIAFSMVALGVFVVPNFGLFALIARKRNFAAAAAAVPLHLMYATVCVVAFAVGSLSPTLQLPPVGKLLPMKQTEASEQGA
jgi:GT2 family glycosyltransferase